MSSSKRAEILEKIKQGFAKPKDLQNDLLILGEETTPKLFTPLSGREKSCYEEEKLHYESTYIRNHLDDKNAHKRNTNPKSNSTHKINSSNKINTPTKVFGKKSYDSIVSWMVSRGNNVILGPFSTKEIVNKINNDELQGCSFKRVNDSVYFSYDEFKNEISLPIFDEKEVIDFISRRELNK